MLDPVFYQFSTSTTLILLVGFYGLTFLFSTLASKKSSSVDGYMVANGAVGFGIAAASMTATWIWAASFYGAASSGYQYGISGSLHYGFWGALMILFIYPYGQRFRELAPRARTLAEIMQARHGSSSQLILAVSNLVGSVISLMVNFTAAGALVSVLTPLSFEVGVVIAGIGVLSYTLWSGFRASILTDFAQVVAMMLVAIVLIPWIYFNMGGSEALSQGFSIITAEQANFFSTKAILEQGAPFFVAVLAYGIGNQTIAQRLFAVRKDLIKSSFITATLGYGSIVIGLGMLGMMALFMGMTPHDGDLNNLIPQVASAYLPPVAIGMLFILVIGSLSSTADSDLSALSAIVMTDIYAKNLAKGKIDNKKMLLLGRITMIIATALGLILASFSFDILVMLVFVGALWGTLVFPVIASCYWDRVTNRAFLSAVLGGLTLFCLVRFEWIALIGIWASSLELIAAVGGGTVIGLMFFGFTNRNVALIAGSVVGVLCAFYFHDFLRDYTVLLGSLVAYGASTMICTAVSLTSNERFDFALIHERVQHFDD
ncbi:sodium:solute symporter family protein [Moritella viscosa]|uniref:Putative transport protein n=1 Tax=Moritella viscosa TaxID=80854 RepID=A0A1L0AAH3_9GAMM|nr:sodium:solute symporter family protein [Moritella viscosa]SGZ11066.1 Putative transport protein [Moritella viscosa]SHO12098.1 Putative transport protein [Moritella viscosa]SHO12102.1 Putative transport protein [Moritella viscosa]SHO16445.1 Putative transport protein [Moritella viscosa]SHO18296.1 Putative transport protein [Moritella viscosa]